MSRPADRFRAIGSIIGIEPLDKVELEMMRLRDNLKGEVESIEGKIDALFTELSKSLGENITRIEEVLPALNKILEEANLPEIETFEDLDTVSEEILKAIKKDVNTETVKVLKDVIGTLETLSIPDDVVSELESLNEKIEQLLVEGSGFDLSEADLLKSELLEMGKSILEKEKIDICPLCEQKIDREKLLSRIHERLRILRSLSKRASEIREISVQVKNKLGMLVNELESLRTKIEPFAELSKEKSELPRKVDYLRDFIHEIASATELEKKIHVQKFNQQKEEIKEFLSSVVTKCKTLLEKMELTDEEKKLLEIIRLIEQVRSKVEEISKLSSELADYRKYYELAEKIYSTFSQVKKQKIQEVYNSIQGDIQRFYSMLHPNEPHGNIELIVALDRRASTELKIESFGQKEDPRALTSEGHLDSLGLCIFLAFVKKFNEGCSLIVLDDVVTTVDARHRENICKLLIEEFGDKQLVITTHDGVWYEQLRAAQRAYGVEGNFKNLSIVEWSVDTGPIIRPYKPRWERIQEKIDSGDKVGAGSEGRQYLEWLLERICELTQAPVPFKSSGRYTVGDLFAPAKKRMDDLVRDEEFKAKALERFKNLEMTIIMGNILSHNNVLGESVSIDEVKSFCNRVRELHEVFLCPECGRFINYYRELKILRCSNPKCKNPIEVRTK
ncbi:hypothetical protein DRP04_13415 [Archaeoglobales archaeon]|nr:MAG: hypothetical protein DRP04_13415 [Archaeoglobales archaeon]